MTEAALKQRIGTAVVLAAVFIATLTAEQPIYFSLLGLAMVVIGGWEWSRLSDIKTLRYRGLYTVFIAVSCLALAAIGADDQAFALAQLTGILYVALLFWLGMAYLVFNYPHKSKRFYTFGMRLIYGTVILLGAWLGLLFLRFHPQGQFWIMVCVAIVAAADIAAYFSGRKFGKRKLAAAVSPGKSWEGFAGGLLAAQLLAVLFYYLSQLSMPMQKIELWQWLFTVLVLSSVSVLGDLTESMVKRVANCKDSGTILPGHGGVLDRIDGLLPVLPLTALFVLEFGW